MPSVIKVRNLGKQYKISHKKGGYVALRDVLTNALSLKKFFLKRGSTTEKFWALKNVDFEVQQGEVLGIIGANGAGKSTLLKILSKITPPTEGEVEMTGSVSSLLEVGTGFHPELTGRENIYLNGAILGMTKAEISERFDEIVEFSGVAAFMDTPVKRYSTGMQVRLAFAVAAHLQSEILVIDEVLAVGDAAFNKKSLGKMEEVTKQQGRTIIFVSHNMDAIARLCDRCLLLEDGKIVKSGAPDEVIDAYLNAFQERGAQKTFERREGKKINLLSTTVYDKDHKVNNRIETGHPFSIILEYELETDLENAYAGIGFIDLKTNTVFLNTLDVDTNPELYSRRAKGRYRSTFNFESPFFGVGNYKLFVHIGSFPTTKELLYKSDGDVSIRFIEGETFVTDFLDGKRNGAALVKIPAQVEKL